MARGATLRTLLSDLRDESRHSNSAAASPDFTPVLRRTLNHVYRTLYYKHDWAFLTYNFPAITLNAGQRYYDAPAGLDPDRVIDARVKWSGFFSPLERGITFDDYTAYDPEENERTSPALKWDYRYTGSTAQIEIWPLPDGSAQSLRLFGVLECTEMVDEDDVCLLDSNVVVLFAAAEILKAQESADADAKLQMANEALRLAKLRSSAAGAPTYRVGLGTGSEEHLNPRTTVRIGGGS